jgi:hypothetical protein
MLHGLGLVVLHRRFLAREEAGDDAAQARVCDPEGGAGRHGLEAARKLVLALRAGLETLQSVVDGVFDAAVVAQLEVQARARACTARR